MFYNRPITFIPESGETMMDELVKLVSQKTGLPQEQAKAAVDTVIGYLKEQLPEPLGGQLEALLSGKGGNPADLLQSLGGLLGGKK
jgi:hypothetical protein